MRISDWSSDVCSSDLPRGRGHARGRRSAGRQAVLGRRPHRQGPTGPRRPAASDRLDGAAGLGPVLVLEQALVELAGGVPRELGTEVDRAWALHVGEVLLAVGDQLALELRARVGHLDGLHPRLALLAEVLVVHADDGYAGHLRVPD